MRRNVRLHLLLLLVFMACALAHVTAVAHVRRKAPVREKKAYDTNIRAFSPDGSIYQVEYALQAAEKGGLTIGVQTDEGLVLAAQGHRRSPLLKRDSVSKISDIDTCMSCAMSGLLPDGRLLVDLARSWVQEHRFEFDEAPSVESVASQLSRLALKFNGYDKDGRQGGGREDDDDLAMSRPIGVAFLLAGLDRGNRPVLYHLDPSGAYVQWRAKAIGEKATVADTKLEEAGPYENMSLRRAMSTVLRALKAVLDEDFSIDNVEMVCIGSSCSGGRNTRPPFPMSSASNQGRVGASRADRGEGARLSTLPREADTDFGDKRSCGDDDGGGGMGRLSLFRRVGKKEMESLLVWE